MKTKKKYLLFLINPAFKYYHYGTQKELGKFLNKKYFNFSLSLPLIASLTPDNYEIKIIDEELSGFPKNLTPDIVGITAVTPTSTRAYQIAKMYKDQNIPVIMGGPHVSFAIDEALQHVDCIVIGEAEGIWQKCLNDFENGKLKKIYRSEKTTEYKTSPIPRWDLIDSKQINILGVQVSRGCPYRCEFCIVYKCFGNKQRYRDIENVIEELKSLPLKNVFFVDDNLTFNKKYAKELMKKIAPLKLSWLCQSSLDIVKDDELLTLMAEAGCISILIGFESVNEKSLKETKKVQNRVPAYENAIKKITEKGIHVIGSFVVGFDSDHLEDFDKIYEFSIKNNLLFVMLSVLTPTPGTDLNEKLKKNNRLIDIDSEFINGTIPCYKYKNMSLVDIYDKYNETIKKIFSIASIKEKSINILKSGNFKKKEIKEFGFFQKFILSLKLLAKYYFFADKEKKIFFKEIIKLGIKKISSWNEIAFILISMQGFLDYLKNTEKYFFDIRKKLKLLDNNKN